MATLSPFETVIDTLRDEGKDFPKRYLTEFSDIEPVDLESLLDAWPGIPLKRKLLLLDQLNALAEKDTLVSFDDLGRALLTDPDAQVRIRAMRLLVECGDTHLIPVYLDIMLGDPDTPARAEAASMLGLFVQLGEFEDVPENDRQKVEQALLEVVNGEDDPSIRRRALEALGFSSRPEIPVLIQSAFDRQDPDWKGSALFAMGRSSDRRWEGPVLRTLLSENRRMRLAAVQAAGELGLGSARPILLQLLTEEDDDLVAGAAIWSLSQIGGEDVRLFLEDLLVRTIDENQAAYIEEALDNLAFTNDMAQFDLMAYDAEEGDED